MGAHFFAPFIPTAAEAIAQKVKCNLVPIPDLKNNFFNLKAGHEVFSNSVLFEPFEVKSSSDTMAAAKTAKEEKKSNQQAKAQPKGKKEPLRPDDPNQPLFSKLDIRVGKIVKAWNHPDADRLFCEEIDIGEEVPRQIVSGLREHYTLEKFQGMKVLVIANMQPSKLKGVTSSGMVLCAKSANKKVVELVTVPDSCNVGDRLLPTGVASSWAPSQPQGVKEYKIWEAVSKDLRSDAKKVACFAGVPLTTEKGAKFVAPTLANVEIG